MARGAVRGLIVVNMLGDLSGKTVLITGASRGIGAASARAAAALGAEVICHGAKPSKHLTAIAKATKGREFTCDLRDEQQLVDKTNELLSSLESLDGLVNCAGTLQTMPLNETSFSDYQQALALHLAAPSLLGALCSERLIAAGGAIVNVSSVRSNPMLTSTRSAPYCTMKAAVDNLSRIQAKEYAPRVRANTVSPGWVETEMSRSWNSASRKQASSNLLQRVAEAKEIAAVICFLLSDSASFITGQNIFVDGGYGLAGK
jgi:NAD(P)-dependent dehydrogenase (short-subunit alcohol dehydrogenase family)